MGKITLILILLGAVVLGAFAFGAISNPFFAAGTPTCSPFNPDDPFQKIENNYFDTYAQCQAFKACYLQYFSCRSVNLDCVQSTGPNSEIPSACLDGQKYIFGTDGCNEVGVNGDKSTYTALKSTGVCYQNAVITEPPVVVPNQPLAEDQIPPEEILRYPGEVLYKPISDYARNYSALILALILAGLFLVGGGWKWLRKLLR